MLRWQRQGEVYILLGKINHCCVFLSSSYTNRVVPFVKMKCSNSSSTFPWKLTAAIDLRGLQKPLCRPCCWSSDALHAEYAQQVGACWTSHHIHNMMTVSDTSTHSTSGFIYMIMNCSETIWAQLPWLVAHCMSLRK